MTAGGSWTIPEVHNFAKTRVTRLRRTASDHSQSFLAMSYELGHNSEKLLGFGALYFDLKGVKC